MTVGAPLPGRPPCAGYLRRSTGKETSRRVEMPPSRLPPGPRARTNITSSCCFCDAGKPRSRFMRSSAHPSAPVVASGGTENMLYGTAVTYTSAPWTALPSHAVMRYRATIVCVEPPTTLGDTCWPATSSRSGGFSSLATGGFLSHGLAVGGAVAAWTTAVGTDVAAVRPSAFFAVTRSRIVLPWSTCFRTYVLSVAPLMFEQLPPSVSQRLQV